LLSKSGGGKQKGSGQKRSHHFFVQVFPLSAVVQDSPLPVVIAASPGF
jgi:hypothetical protein